MSVVVEVPRRLYEEAVKRGIGVEELIISVLRERLGLGPREVAEARLELAERFLEEAKEYLRRGDVVQASEKLYKAAEECVKVLAEHLGLPEAGKAKGCGRWYTWLLGRAAARASRLLGEPRIRSAWANAYDVHVWGFHEAKYDVETLEAVLPDVEWLVGYVRQLLQKTGGEC